MILLTTKLRTMKIFKKEGLDIRTESGFSTLYENYVEYVYSVCHRYLGDEHLSEDITSKIFISLWERREVLHQETWKADSWRRYLAKAAKYKVYDYLRSQEQLDSYLSEKARELHPAENTIEKELYFGELTEHVRLYVNQLPPRCKQVFQLSREKGLANKEIAHRLSISDNAVKKHIAKALSYLRENLTDYPVPKRSTGT